MPCFRETEWGFHRCRVIDWAILRTSAIRYAGWPLERLTAYRFPPLVAIPLWASESSSVRRVRLGTTGPPLAGSIFLRHPNLSTSTGLVPARPAKVGARPLVDRRRDNLADPS